MLSQSQILKNSAELRRFSELIHTTVRTLSNSPEDRAQWEDACAEFHRKFDSLCFPGGAEMFNRVRKNDPEALEAAIRFLVADPYHFRSGYLKENLWRWLRHYRLSTSARNRLEKAAFSVSRSSYIKRVLEHVQGHAPVRGYRLLGQGIFAGANSRKPRSPSCLVPSYFRGEYSCRSKIATLNLPSTD